MKLKQTLPLLLLLLTACTHTEPTPTTPTETPTQPSTTTATEAETMPETEPAVTEASADVNPLTGETGYPEEAVGKRPVAVMINNLAAAYPQYGIAQADILYEVPVEGGITRMMGVYADLANVPDVGSVRSARYYFPKIAMGMDAIYCHWGAEQVHATAAMDRMNIDHFDGGKLMGDILFYRDEERVGKYASEHTGYLKGADVPALIERYEVREYAVRQDAAFQFAAEVFVPGGEDCVMVEIPFSDSSSTGFTLDPSRDVYTMEHNGSPQMDGHTGEAAAFRNVFVLQTEVTWMDESKYLRRVELEGGSGYYISMGSMQEIRWEKADDRSPIVYYAADGAELEVNPGNSYIAIVGKGRKIAFTASHTGDAPIAY